MKKALICLTLLTASTFIEAQQSYTVCPGAVKTLSIANSWNLTDVSYSLNPGGVTSPNGVWTVTVQTPGTYVMFITGDNTSATPVTYSTTVHIAHHPIPDLTTVQSPQNFTLGCGQKATATINITPAPPSFMPIVYTVVPLGYTISNLNGWQSKTTYAVSQAGHYRAMAAYAGSAFCYDTLSFWATENKVTPVFDSFYFSPKGFLCLYNLDHPQIVHLKAYTKGHGTHWTLPSGATSNNESVAVMSTGPFTVTTLDSGTDCPGDSVVTVPDFRIYPTLAVQSQYTLCNTPSIAISATVGWNPDSVTVEWKEVIDWQPDKVWGTGTLLTVWMPGTYTVYATNEHGCYLSKKVHVLGCVGLAEELTAPPRMWPNPVANEFHLYFADNKIQTATLMNSLGQEVDRFIFSGETVIDLSRLPLGVFFLKCEGWMKKIIKK